MQVYIATNKINGNRYIGATKRAIEIRRARHWYDANNRNLCRVFGAALKKYGQDAFEWKTIVECSSVEEMMDHEIRLIAELKPEYNITSGGHGVRGIPRTKQWLERMSASQKGKKKSPEAAAKCAAHLRSIAPNNYKSVVCLTDGRFFESCKAAAGFYGITHTNVRSVASETQATTKGLSFAFSKSPLNADECAAIIARLQEQKLKNIKRARSHKCRPVICITDGKQYKDANEAAAFYGITSGRVRQLYHDGGTTQSGLAFCLVGRQHPVKKELSPERKAAAKVLVLAALKRGLLKTRKRVICLDNNVVYESISAAARSVGRSVESVSASIRRNGKCGKKTFKFFEGNF